MEVNSGLLPRRHLSNIATRNGIMVNVDLFCMASILRPILMVLPPHALPWETGTTLLVVRTITLTGGVRSHISGQIVPFRHVRPIPGAASYLRTQKNSLS